MNWKRPAGTPSISKRPLSSLKAAPPPPGFSGLISTVAWEIPRPNESRTMPLTEAVADGVGGSFFIISIIGVLATLPGWTVTIMSAPACSAPAVDFDRRRGVRGQRRGEEDWIVRARRPSTRALHQEQVETRLEAADREPPGVVGEAGHSTKEIRRFADRHVCQRHGLQRRIRARARRTDRRAGPRSRLPSPAAHGHRPDVRSAA